MYQANENGELRPKLLSIGASLSNRRYVKGVVRREGNRIFLTGTNPVMFTDVLRKETSIFATSVLIFHVIISNHMQIGHPKYLTIPKCLICV